MMSPDSADAPLSDWVLNASTVTSKEVKIKDEEIIESGSAEGREPNEEDKSVVAIAIGDNAFGVPSPISPSNSGGRKLNYEAKFLKRKDDLESEAKQGTVVSSAGCGAK
ncbi:hypothetical protein U1Q18_027977 [Sarracenia purpurea var. burkii]